jgi:hypothetical protein
MGGVEWRSVETRMVRGAVMGAMDGIEDEEEEDDDDGGVFPGVQGATVLHCLARLHEMAIQGAT